MVITNAPILGLTTTVIDVIVEQVVRKYIENVGLTEFIGDNLYFISPHTASSKTNDNELNATLSDNRFECKIDYTLDPTKVKFENGVTRHTLDYGAVFNEVQNLPTVFLDTELRSIIKEHSVPCSVALTCQFKILKRTDADTIFGTILNTYANSQSVFNIDTVYNYFVPDATINFMGYLFLLSGLYPTIQFDQFIAERCEKQISRSFNQNLTKLKAAFVINKTEVGMVVKIGLNNERPEPVLVGKSTNHYTIELTLDFQFNRPNLLFTLFPIIIKNQLVNSVFLPDNLIIKADELKNTTHPYMAIQNGVGELETVYKDELFRQPFYDNFTIPLGPYKLLGFKPFYLAACSVDTVANTVTVDFKTNLGDDNYQVHVRDEILSLLVDHTTAALDGSLPIVVLAFCDNKLIPLSRLTYEDNVLTITDCNIDNIYRIALCERTEVTNAILALRVLKCDLIVN